MYNVSEWSKREKPAVLTKLKDPPAVPAPPCPHAFTHSGPSTCNVFPHQHLFGPNILSSTNPFLVLPSILSSKI